MPCWTGEKCQVQLSKSQVFRKEVATLKAAYKLFALYGGVVLFLSSSHALEEIVLDQSQSNVNLSAGFGGVYERAQSFTVGVSGTLDRIEVTLSSSSGGS